jgi:membrane-associated protease RseP (regulator of RpoE activity)
MAETYQQVPPYVARRAGATGRAAARPTAREWARHALLFMLTALTLTFAGVELMNTAPVYLDLPAPAAWYDYASYVPTYYALTVIVTARHALATPALLAQGATFACALLSILLSHEAGHYVACRRYGVEATLPFFMPAPPGFSLGTFGAFIKIKSPIPTRRALFDIGVAGPLAGFIVIIPVAIAALLNAQPAPPALLESSAATAGTLITFNDPPLLRLFAHALGVNLTNIAPNPFYFAAWIGLLVTSLNLLPVGQLDGGHAVYALFGKRTHARVGRLAFVSMALLAVLGWYWHNSPGGFLYALLLFVMLRVPHPQATDESAPLGRARTLVAILTLTVFLLSFVLFPITIS